MTYVEIWILNVNFGERDVSRLGGEFPNSLVIGRMYGPVKHFFPLIVLIVEVRCVTISVAMVPEMDRERNCSHGNFWSYIHLVNVTVVVPNRHTAFSDRVKNY